MKLRYLPLCMLLVCSASQAETPRQEQQQANSQAQNAQLQQAEGQSINQRPALPAESQAQQWGLTREEWTQYQQLMTGQRGIWSPGLDPLTALGVEARTDAERRHYAELWARAEYERVERELAFERERVAAIQRLYPGVRAVDYTPARRGSDVLKMPGDKRLFLFAGQSCPDCHDRIGRLVALLGTETVLDIYVLGLAGDDDALRRWARDNGVPLSDVQTGRVTLNHDGGMLSRLRLDAKSLPQMLVRGPDGTLSPYSF